MEPASPRPVVAWLPPFNFVLRHGLAATSASLDLHVARASPIASQAAISAELSGLFLSVSMPAVWISWLLILADLLSELLAAAKGPKQGDRLHHYLTWPRP